VSRALAVLVLMAGLGACVMETTGGPVPASADQRLQAQLSLARGYLESEHRARAIEPLDRALEINPRSADALLLYGVFYQAEEDFNVAEQYYRRALRADARHAASLNNLAVLLYGQGRYREAVQPLRILVRDTSYRNRDLAFENLGLTERQLGMYTDARASFSRALNINEALPVSHLELADLEYQAGNYQAALRHYDRFRSLARQSARSLCLGIALTQVTGDHDQRASFEIALRNLFPDSPEAHQCLQGS
jgi:type IV pilus assembly protein PilF